MKIITILLFILFNIIEARTITDHYGRVVEIPQKVNKIYAASPPITMSLLSFDPSLIAALNSPFNDEQKRYVGVAKDRPVVGGFMGQGQSPNFEVLAKVKPDIIIMWGRANSYEMQLKKFEALGIPVLLIKNDTIYDLIEQYKLYGEISGNRARADELIAYTKETLELYKKLKPKLNKEIRYYFAEGIDGLSSECDGSFHLEPFNYAGAKNALNCKMSSNYGMEKISAETLLMADPDFIVVLEKSFYKNIKKSAIFSRLRAVKNNKVLLTPSEPFNYITRPPSFMRLMGIRWLIENFYPNSIKPIKDEQRRFIELFFPQKEG